MKSDKFKVHQIYNMHVTTFVAWVISVFGYVGFYRIFIKDLSKMAWSLTNIIFKGIPFVFDESCVQAFKKLCFLLLLVPYYITT